MTGQLAHIVQEVGASLLAWRAADIIDGHWDGAQFKARADKMAHQALSALLLKLAPRIPIISEEDTGSLVRERPSRYWLIDPIDGTASFVNGFQGYVTQVALIEDDAPSLAAIYAPDLKLLYTAERTKGAFLNEKRLQVTAADNELTTLIDNYPEPRGTTLAAFNELPFKKYIECGSISLKICKVADGTANVFFKDVTIRDWDVAAPQLVLEEAGGMLREITGHAISYMGGYEHPGLVAAESIEVCRRIVSWYDSYRKRGVSQ